MRILLLVGLVLLLGGCESDFDACMRRGLQAYADSDNEYSKSAEKLVFANCSGAVSHRGRRKPFGRIRGLGQ
jgi:hypothetical protein